MTNPTFITSSYFPTGMPQPDPDDPVSAGHWAACAEGRFTVQRCRDCDTAQHPPELNCHHCHGFDLHWVDAAPAGRAATGPTTGKVWSHVTPAHPAHPALKDHGPYNVSLIQLDDVPEIRVIGNVIDIDPAQVQIGLAVEVVFERTTDDLVQPRWRPRDQ